MHDTDMAGILYFANQFRFAHDALEDMLKGEGYTIYDIFHRQNFVMVIVHVEADYFAPLRGGEDLEVHLTVEKIGTSSITFCYHIYKSDHQLVGTAKTVHVTLDTKTHKKVPVPHFIHEKLLKYTSKPGNCDAHKAST